MKMCKVNFHFYYVFESGDIMFDILVVGTDVIWLLPEQMCHFFIGCVQIQLSTMFLKYKIVLIYQIFLVGYKIINTCSYIIKIIINQIHFFTHILQRNITCYMNDYIMFIYNNLVLRSLLLCCRSTVIRQM